MYEGDLFNKSIVLVCTLRGQINDLFLSERFYLRDIHYSSICIQGSSTELKNYFRCSFGVYPKSEVERESIGNE